MPDTYTIIISEEQRLFLITALQAVTKHPDFDQVFLDCFVDLPDYEADTHYAMHDFTA